MSWHEQRQFGIDYPIEALGSHPLAAAVRKELAALQRGQVTLPDVREMRQVSNLSAVPCGQTTLGFGADGSLR
eukprot:SAG31_NODE_44218_length_263_cov_1.560976_1_plen_72_part_10